MKLDEPQPGAPKKAARGRPIGTVSGSKRLSLSVAAQLAGLDPVTLKGMAQQGDVPFERTESGQFRFRRADIDAVRLSIQAARPDPARPLICALVPHGKSKSLAGGMRRVGEKFGCRVEIFSLADDGVPPADLILKITAGEPMAVLLQSIDEVGIPKSAATLILELCRAKQMPIIIGNGGDAGA